ncbi:scavenger receptor cysteine-rich type 1 protein M130-like isoform X1, partial [Lates japonicus]
MDHLLLLSSGLEAEGYNSAGKPQRLKEIYLGISQKFKRSTPLWRINFDCVRSGSALTDCVSSSYSPVRYFAPSVTCS